MEASADSYQGEFPSAYRCSLREISLLSVFSWILSKAPRTHKAHRSPMVLVPRQATFALFFTDAEVTRRMVQLAVVIERFAVPEGTVRRMF